MIRTYRGILLVVLLLGVGVTLNGQDETTLIKFSQVFWAEKAMQQSLRDSMEVVVADYFENSPSAVNVSDAVINAFVQDRKADYDRIASDSLDMLCSRYRITVEAYIAIKDRYHADTRYQSEIYPILIKHTGDEG